MITTIFAYARHIAIKLLAYERCIHRLTLSCCIGIYIAFSPFVGLHTAMVFLFSWLFALNFAVILLVSMGINNPWTMMPVYGAGHFFGDRVLTWIGVNHYAWNPSWIESANQWIKGYIGLGGISFWAFMIGGNILGVGLSILCYPMIKRMLSAFKAQGKKRVKQTVVCSKRVAKKLAAQAKPLLHKVKQKVGARNRYEDHHAK
jgi:uncharacterized protein (DUF2062 family)